MKARIIEFLSLDQNRDVFMVDVTIYSRGFDKFLTEGAHGFYES